MAQTSVKKPSFFRRLSLSGSAPAPVGSSSSNATTPSPARNNRTLGGPAYENLPPGAAPSAYQSDRKLNHDDPSPRRSSMHTQTARGSGRAKERSPIYPALASPPNSPPRPVRREDAYNPTMPTQASQHRQDATPAKQSHRISRYADADVFQSQPIPILPTKSASTPKRTVSSRPPIRNTSSELPASSSPTPVLSPTSVTVPALSEASAYARQVASSYSRSPSRDGATSAPPAGVARRASRPLPRPPSTSASARSVATVHVIAHNDGKRQSVSPKAPTRPSIVIPHEEKAADFIAFPRSPTLPPLVDPRSSQTPVEQWSKRNVSTPGAPLSHSQLPVRTISVSQKRSVSSPMTVQAFQGPLHTSPSRTSITSPQQTSVTSPHPAHRPRLRPSLALILAQPQIQAALLPYLSINSFLSLTGASDVIRKRFSGETVGRWVMREWGIAVDKEKGRSWPNLTVWEGFLESLLHDPATYSTYPAQWHNLLRHLSLSHTLIVLHLRSLPLSAFSLNAPLPFEDEIMVPPSASRPHSRVSSDAGSIALTKMPRQERLMEIVMPEPLAARPEPDLGPVRLNSTVSSKLQRRSSISSLASAASFSFGRKRANSTSVSLVPAAVTPAAPMPTGKAALPPVSYPVAKRYNFTRHGDQPRSRTFSETSRPGSVFSVATSPSVALSTWITSQKPPPLPAIPSPIMADHRTSFASESRSPLHRFGSPFRRDHLTPPPKVEPAFDKAPPFMQGRAPILRVFVPISERVPRWPSAEGAAVAVAELDKCGATRRLRFGDLIVNTACKQPKTTEHVLIFVPFIKHLLVPLEYRFCATGHLPAYVDGFALPPSYYYPFLPSPQIIYLDLLPYKQRGMQSIRLAFDRRDVTVASGARMAAKRYLHVAGFEISADDPAAAEWQGMVSLEADGTAEGKAEIIRRLHGAKGPWEIVREKSMVGTVWLRMIKE